MENLNQQDINKLTKTILIGLPGVGKSTLTDEICRLIEEKTNIHIENVSSDLRLRDVRKDANNPVVKKFMASHKIPRSDFDLLIKTNEFMKKYGEPVPLFPKAIVIRLLSGLYSISPTQEED